MSYDLKQVVKVSGEQVMVMFNIKSEYRDGKKVKKVMTGYDEMGGTYTAIGVNDENEFQKLNATEVVKL